MAVAIGTDRAGEAVVRAPDIGAALASRDPAIESPGLPVRCELIPET